MASVKGVRDVLIVGVEPTEMMSGLILARAGMTVNVVDRHADFFSDFRGATVHLSTIEILEKLG